MNNLRQALCRLSAAWLVHRNLDPGLVVAWRSEEGFPTLVLSDGTRLAVRVGRHPELKPPCGLRQALLDLVTRYLYPHFDPSRVIRTGAIPRRLFPTGLHPQHRNTLSELPQGAARQLRAALRLRPGDQVLEAGAYLGLGTVRMARLIGPSGRIVSLEPDHRAFQVLRRNCEVNRLHQVQTIQTAIADRTATDLPFWRGGAQSNSLIRTIVKRGVSGATPSMTIAEVVRRMGLDPDFLVLTVNGFELRALQAVEDLLRAPKARRIVAPGWYDDGDGQIGVRLARYLRDCGYRVFVTPGLHVFAYKC